MIVRRYCLVGIGIMFFGVFYWAVWRIVLPKLGNYKLVREKESLEDGTVVTIVGSGFNLCMLGNLLIELFLCSSCMKSGIRVSHGLLNLRVRLCIRGFVLFIAIMPNLELATCSTVLIPPQSTTMEGNIKDGRTTKWSISIPRFPPHSLYDMLDVGTDSNPLA
jgi:hypothetical protein